MKKNLLLFFAASFSAFLFSCQSSTSTTETKEVIADSLFPAAAAYKTTIDNKETGLYLIKNKNGSQVAITNYGARVVGLAVPGKDGKLVDVVLGYDSVKTYQKKR